MDELCTANASCLVALGLRRLQTTVGNLCQKVASRSGQLSLAFDYPESVVCIQPRTSRSGVIGHHVPSNSQGSAKSTGK